MSSEFLASGENVLDSNLGGAWDIINGYAGRKRDLGIARRFGGAAAAYSLRDIGAMNGRVVKARRDVGETSDPEEDFSANQVSSGALEDWVNGKLEDTLPADSSQGLTVVVQHSLINSGTETTIKFYADSLTSGSPRFFSNDKTYKFYKGLSDNRYILQLTDSTNLIKASASDADKLPQDVTTYESVTGTLTSITVTSSSPAAAAYSLRKVDSSYSGNAVRIRRISDDIEVNVAFDSDGKVSASSPITDGGTELTPDPDADLGSTTANTLGGFLTESATYFDTTGASSTTVQGASIVVGSNIGSVAFNSSDGFEGDASFTFTGANSSASFADNFYWHNTFSTTSHLGTPSSEKLVTVQAYVKRTNGSSGDLLTFREYATTNTTTFTDLPLNEWKLVTGSIPTTNATSTDHIQIGGTNGTTFKLSLVKYSVNLQDAFVHTWYDQAGSNNAVQDTAANQPKIAESGALLADGLDFDGSNDFLGFGADICDNINNFSAFTLAKSDGGNGALQVLFSVGFSGDGTIFAQARDDSNIEAHFGDGSSSSNVVNLSQAVSQFESDMLFTTIGGSSTSKGFADAVEGGSVSSASANPTNATGGIGMHIGSSSPFDGSVKEAIFYNSDQSANRFKIESNINNYHGLYNDELELNGEALPASSAVIGGVTYSSGTLVTLPNKNSLEYTLNDVETGNRFMRYMVNPNGNLTNLSNGDKVYISFNLTAPDGLLIIAQLRDNFTGVSGTASFSGSGFKSFSLTRNSTAGTIDNIMFQSSGVGNATISMTDIKVSRIARDGFVETLYDQSGNGRDISQASASNQPTIVSNGGIYKSGAYPSIRYTDTSATYLVTESYSPVEQGGSGMPNFTLFAVTGIPESAGFDSIVSAGGSEGSNSIGGFKLRHLKDASGNIDSRIDIAQTGVSPHQANAQSNNATPQSVNLHTSYLDSTDDELFAQQNSATSGTTTTTLIPLSGQGAENDNLKVGTDMFNDSPRASYLGEILEIILYTDSKKSDLSDLTDEINNFYNI